LRGSALNLADLPGRCNTVVGEALSKLTRPDERTSQNDEYVTQYAIEVEDTQAKQLVQLASPKQETHTCARC